MKKVIVITVLIFCLLTMGNAYALWTDSADAGVSINSAVVRFDYVGRSTASSDIVYVQQGSGSPSTSNRYDYIQEAVFDMEKNEYLTVTYTVKNTGEVPVYFTGLRVDDITLYATKSNLINKVRIEYSVRNDNPTPSFYSTVLVDDVDTHEEVTFPDAETDNILYSGETCTLTVTYYRTGGKKGYVDITKKIDIPVFSIA